MKHFLIMLLFFIATFKLFPYDTLNIVFSRVIGSENYKKYCTYLKSVYPNINCINAYGTAIEDVPKLFNNAFGLVLTGGPDLNPSYYGKEKDSSLCEIDSYRDSLEFKLLDIAFHKKIPIFAICRGEQVLNVYLGGSLYPDIPTYLPSQVTHRCDNKQSGCFHVVYIDKNSRFYKWLGVDSVLVNSFHHQGVDRLASELQPSAFSTDGLVEAYEWKDANKEPFFIAVQWHPERMAPENTISRKLAETFIKKVLEYKQIKFNQKK
ncbi:MAG: gamma-glutamyl-gamma-aminobutyrate hydrolase family protein [Candidatus Kapaibacteriota bacterium]